MSQTFSCPNCTANLEHDGGNHLTIQCPYCNSTVIVPEELRPRAHRQDFAPLLAQQNALREVVRFINMNELAEAIDIYKNAFNVDDATAADAVRRLASGLSLANQHISTVQIGQQTGSGGRGCLISTIVLILVLVIAASVLIPIAGGVAAFLAFLPGFGDDLPAINVPEIVSVATPNISGDVDAVLTSVAEDFAGITALSEAEEASANSQIFAIGERGINPSQFNDARAVAVGNDGTIYVADRNSGRFQIFAADGTYQTTLPWDKEKYTDDIEIAADGTLYAEQSSDIYRYNVATGELLGQVTGAQALDTSFGQLALAVNGDLLATTVFGRSIMRFNSNGELVQTIDIESVPSAISFDDVAVDGLGNVYAVGAAEDVLGDRQDVVFKFTADGQFATQFGSSGSEPGFFLGTLSDIAVDGQGRIYVADFLGIQVFDNNGRFLNLLTLEGAAFDMAITNQNELVAITSQNKLYKFDLSTIGN